MSECSCVIHTNASAFPCHWERAFLITMPLGTGENVKISHCVIQVSLAHHWNTLPWPHDHILLLCLPHHKIHEIIFNTSLMNRDWNFLQGLLLSSTFPLFQNKSWQPVQEDSLSRSFLSMIPVPLERSGPSGSSEQSAAQMGAIWSQVRVSATATLPTVLWQQEI